MQMRLNMDHLREEVALTEQLEVTPAITFGRIICSWEDKEWPICKTFEINTPWPQKKEPAEAKADNAALATVWQ